MAQTTNYHLNKPAYTDTADIADINDNMDIIDGALAAHDTALAAHDTALAGKKTKQTAKVDPTASGTAVAFIDTIEQNANGEITATKKSLPYAGDNAIGCIKTGFTQQGRYYPVKLSDSSHNAYVNVPWTDTQTLCTIKSLEVSVNLTPDATKAQAVAINSPTGFKPVAIAGFAKPSGVEINFVSIDDDHDLLYVTMHNMLSITVTGTAAFQVMLCNTTI